MLLANHAPVGAGKTLETARYATGELEETANLFLLLRDRNPSALLAEQLAEDWQVIQLDQ